MADICQILGTNVRTLRQHLGISQEKLAERVDVSTKHINRLDNGKAFPSLKLLEGLAAALGVETEELFSSKGAQIVSVGTISLEKFKDKLIDGITRLVTEDVASLTTGKTE
jgi:transcriptional regulator with XRE-family HTH domain